ncbi:NAD(P)H-binding protein [Micromonospora arborensis]|uniref:NAD(P)-dependent oxidoreductase n=1 Tax=Micromonospora arborensis TaxID=2116518 RepID=UPI0033DBD9BC
MALFGGTGRTGQVLVAQALDQGHQVTALVRSPDRLPIDHPALTKVQMYEADPQLLRADLKAADAVVSVLNGSVRAGSPATTWTRAALSAMAECDIRRLVVTSAAPIPLRGGPAPLSYRLVGAIFRDSHRDLAAMEEVVQGSDVNWTIVRPPRLTNGPRTGRYRREVGGNVPRGLSISRADLAGAILRLIDDPAVARRGVGVAY